MFRSVKQQMVHI